MLKLLNRQSTCYVHYSVGTAVVVLRRFAPDRQNTTGARRPLSTFVSVSNGRSPTEIALW